MSTEADSNYTNQDPDLKQVPAEGIWSGVELAPATLGSLLKQDAQTELDTLMRVNKIRRDAGAMAMGFLMAMLDNHLIPERHEARAREIVNMWENAK